MQIIFNNKKQLYEVIAFLINNHVTLLILFTLIMFNIFLARIPTPDLIDLKFRLKKNIFFDSLLIFLKLLLCISYCDKELRVYLSIMKSVDNIVGSFIIIFNFLIYQKDYFTLLPRNLEHFWIEIILWKSFTFSFCLTNEKK
jgi:hypothetical protein